jgi:hypothetical protein
MAQKNLNIDRFTDKEKVKVELNFRDLFRRLKGLEDAPDGGGGEPEGYTTWGTTIEGEELYVSIGDYNGAVNGTTIEIDDAGSSVDIYADNINLNGSAFMRKPDYFQVRDSPGSGYNQLHWNKLELSSGFGDPTIYTTSGFDLSGRLNFSKDSIVCSPQIIPSTDAMGTFLFPNLDAIATEKTFVMSVNGVDAGIDGNVITGSQQVKVSLSAAQIKALGTTPIDLIPAPGAGKYIRVTGMDYDYNYTAAPFDANSFTVDFDGAGDNIIFPDLNLATTADDWAFASPINEHKNLENTKVVVNGTDSVATGDGVLTLNVTYMIMTR